MSCGLWSVGGARSGVSPWVVDPGASPNPAPSTAALYQPRPAGNLAQQYSPPVLTPQTSPNIARCLPSALRHLPTAIKRASIFNASPLRRCAMTVESLSSNVLNYLVWRYLQEAGTAGGAPPPLHASLLTGPYRIRPRGTGAVAMLEPRSRHSALCKECVATRPH
jgi:hypothetical protein